MRSAAAASWRWPARSASRPTPRSSGSRRSTSGIIPGYAGTQRLPRLVGTRTGARAAADRRPDSGRRRRIASASSIASSPAANLMARSAEARRGAGGEGADRGALHHRGGQQGARDAVAEAQVFEATLFGLVASDRRHARGNEGVPREAQAGVQGEVAVAPSGSATPPALPASCRVPLRRDRVALQRRRSPSALRDGARAALVEAGASERHRGVRRARARSSCRRRRAAPPRPAGSTRSSAWAA